jgi:glycosyltransferase involved in cell wall biosynthesis
MPRVSVVMPALNAERTIAESLESLAKQTFTDFEVVVVDDGSSDRTAEIASGFAGRVQVRVIRHESPLGVARSINDGLAATDSELVARLDSDDLALPNRFERQVGWMDGQPSVGVCGSHMTMFEEGSEQRSVLAHPTLSSEIRTALVQRCAIAHPSVVFRRAVIDRVGNYDERFDFAEDYELWCRASLLGVQFANVPEPLTLYRRHPGQVGKRKAQIQFERDLQIKDRYMSAWLGGDAVGFTPHFLSLQTQFPSKEVAIAVFNEVSAVLVRLAKVLPDGAGYSRILAQSVIRHCT